MAEGIEERVEDGSEAAADGPSDRLAAELRRKLESGTALVGIIGLGYVGLPLALAFSEKGYSVLGFDVDSTKVEALNGGRCYIEHLEAARVAAQVSASRLAASCDFDRLGEPDVLLICVPTPLDRYRQPDLSYVQNTGQAISRTLRPGQLVILESTTYPGTTEEELQPLLQQGGLLCGRDFFLAFSPEREDPGNPDFGTTGIPKVVGGVDKVSGDLAEAFYGLAFSSTVRVSSARAAEATKLMENIFRAVNIALVNELKTVYGAMGIDIWEVIEAAATKPFGFMRFDPGPGWGGHCIPIDPFYLSWKAREYGQQARFIELAGEVCREMPARVVATLQHSLNERGKAVRGSKVLILGIAYKPDVDDPRESPAFEIIDQLLSLGAEISYHDPHISVSPEMRSWPDLPRMHSLPLSAEVLAAHDVALLVTHHTAVDYALVVEHAPLVIDTRGVYRQANPRVVKA